MIKNYLRIAIRNLLRHRVYSTINVAGLTVGIAASLLIFLVVKYEMSYDQFQPNYDRIYRVVTHNKTSDGTDDYNPGTPCPAYDALKNDFTQFEKIAPVAASSDNQFTVLGKDANLDLSKAKKFIESGQMVFTYPEYFDIFHANWLTGNSSLLKEPGNIIIDKTSAEKFFGNWKDAVGQYVKVNNHIVLTVAGVIEDARENSDLPIRFFLSYEVFKDNGTTYNYYPDWGAISSNHQIYVLLKQQVSEASLTPGLTAFAKKYYNPGPGEMKSHLLQPMNDFHFNELYGTLGDHRSSKPVLMTLALIGVLIIVMASINFINLSTAQAVSRGKEVGIRKVLGSKRGQLIAQIFGETFLIVLMAVLLAIGLSKLVMPLMSKVANLPTSTSLITLPTLFFLFTVLVVVTFISGIYPALVVSGFKPILALKNKISAASVGGLSLRRVLVVAQFAISQALMVGTIVAVKQMNFVQAQDLGFDRESVFMVPTYSDSANLPKMNALKQELQTNPNIISVAFASDEASSDNNWSGNFAYNHQPDAKFASFFKFGDNDYFNTFGVEFIAGKGYAKSDTAREAVVNETILSKLGVKNPQEAIGKDIRIGSGSWLRITGVVKDFKTNSLREEVKPLIITSRNNLYYTIAIKMKTANLSQTVAQVKKTWEATYPEYAFSSHFVDETLENFYRQEEMLTLLYKIFAIIALFISCLGLYGLVSFMATQKTKEVGIRKVLGASVGSIIYLFSKEFTILIAIAFVIAAPLAWYLMSQWLDNFVFKIDIGLGIFLLAIIASILIAWITVGYKAIRAALVNPVRSLRSE